MLKELWMGILVTLELILSRLLHRWVNPWIGSAKVPNLQAHLLEQSISIGQHTAPYRYFAQEAPFTCGYAAIRMIFAGRGTETSERELLDEARRLKTYSDKHYFMSPDLARFLKFKNLKAYYSYNWEEDDLAVALVNGLPVLLTVNALRLNEIYKSHQIEIRLPSWAYEISEDELFDGHIVLLHGIFIEPDQRRVYCISDPATPCGANLSISAEELRRIAWDVWSIGRKIEAVILGLVTT
jgi:hypothetical protein